MFGRGRAKGGGQVEGTRDLALGIVRRRGRVKITITIEPTGGREGGGYPGWIEV